MATNLEFIKSASGTSVSYIDVTDCFSANYDVYKIMVSKSDVDTQTYSWIRLLDSTNTVITANEYDYASMDLASSTTFGENRGTNGTAFFNTDVQGTDTAKGIGLVVYIYNPYDSNSYTFANWQSSGVTSVLYGTKGIAVHKVAEQINGFRYIRGAGNFDSVTINVFGVK
jgi:hypothetical protein